tara:strand:- start:656 stop:943 length:288 start_codon:yes stop_codon:yes gene_type:complete
MRDGRLARLYIEMRGKMSIIEDAIEYVLQLVDNVSREDVVHSLFFAASHGDETLPASGILVNGSSGEEGECEKVIYCTILRCDASAFFEDVVRVE